MNECWVPAEHEEGRTVEMEREERLNPQVGVGGKVTGRRTLLDPIAPLLLLTAIAYLLLRTLI